MADKKISELVSLAGKDVAATDFFPVVDVSVAETKSLTRDELRNAVNAIHFTATKALATTAAASLPDDTIIEVAADESLSWDRTRYTVTAGALVFAYGVVTKADLADTSDPAKGAALVGFLPGGTGAVARNARDKLRETISVKDFGAVGDGVTDDAEVIQSAVNESRVVALPGPSVFNVDSSFNGVVIPTQTTMVGTGQTALSANGVNHRAITVDAEVTLPINTNLLSLVVSGNTNNSDDWAPVRVAAKGSMVFGNYVPQANYGMTLSYSVHNDKTERRSSELRAIGNWSKGSGSGFEIFSVKNSSAVGNVAVKDGTRATGHGFRFTGYGAAQPAPGTNLKLYGLASAGNIVNNYLNGVSQQTGVYATAHSGYSITGCTTGIQFTINISNAENQSKNNVFSGVAIDDVTTGILLERTEKTVIDAFSISNASYRGISAKYSSSAGTYGTGKYNRFSGLVTDYTGADDPVRIETSNGRWDLTVADIGGAFSRGVRVTGSYNIITLVGGGSSSTSSAFLGIEGSNNIVFFAGDNIAQMFSEVIISGNDNLFFAMLDQSDTGGKIAVTGTGNQIIGNVGLLSVPGASNRVDGVMRCKAQGSISGTTDGSGDITVPLPYTMLSSSYAVMLSQSSTSGGTPYLLQAHTKTTTSFKVRVFTTAGAAATSTAITVGYDAIVTG